MDDNEIKRLRKQSVLKTIDDATLRLLVSDSVFEHRYTICKSCEKYDDQYGRCKMCGCFVKYKTKLKKSYCPLHKWEKVND
jgi:hypothetical protein